MKKNFKESASFLPWIIISLSVLISLVLTLAGYYLMKGDIIETFHMGRDINLFYPKHPPITFWFAGVVLRAFPIEYLLFASTLILYAGYAFVAWLSWRFSAVYIDAFRTRILVVAAVALSLFAKYIYLTPDYMALVLTTPILWFFHRAVHEDRLTDWLLLVLCSLLFFFSKYQAVVTLLTIFLTLLVTQDGRRCFKSRNFWIAAITFVLIVVPYAGLLMFSNVQAFRYAQQGAGMNDSFDLGLALNAPFAVAFLPIVYALIFFSKQKIFQGMSDAWKNLHEWSFDTAFLWMNSVGYWTIWLIFCLVFQHELQARFLILNVVPFTILFFLIFKPSIEAISDKGIKVIFSILTVAGVLAFANSVYEDNNWQEFKLYQQAYQQVKQRLNRPVDYIVVESRSFDTFYLAFSEKPYFRNLSWHDEAHLISELKGGNVLLIWRVRNGERPAWVKRFGRHIPVGESHLIRLQQAPSSIMGLTLKSATFEMYYAVSPAR